MFFWIVQCTRHFLVTRPILDTLRPRAGAAAAAEAAPECAKASGAAASDRNPFWCHWQSRPVQVTSHPVVTLAGHLKRSAGQLELAGGLGLAAGGGRGLTAQIFSKWIAQA